MVALAYVGLMSATLRAEPQITGVTQYFGGFHVRVSGIEKPTYLMQVYDAVDCGDPLADWPTIRYVCTLAAGQVGVTCPLPADWGVSVRAMRFFLIDKENAYIRVVGSGTTGGQYVQTDTTLTGGSRVRMELAVMDDTANGCPFCARTLAGAAKRFAIFTQFATSGNNKKNWRYDYAGKNGDCSGSYQLEEPLTIDFNGPNCTVDGTPLVNDYARGPVQSFATPGLALFAAYTTQSDDVTSKITGYTAKGNFKVWSTQVWLDGADESSLALDLLPGKTNGRACLVDMKTGRPYYGKEEDFAVCFDSPCALSASFTADTTPAVVYDAGSYAQNSHLIAQWDAIENAGRGVHSDAPSTWVDLIGNAQNITASDALQYQPTAVYFPGGLNGTYYLACNIPQIKDALSNKSCTVEMQLNVVEPIKNQGSYITGGILQVGGTDENGKDVNHRELVIYQRDNRNLTPPHETSCDTFGSLQYATTSMDATADMPPANNHYGKDVLMTVVVDGDSAKLYVDCEHLHTSPGKGDVPPLDFFRVGSWGKTLSNGKWTRDPGNGSSRMYVRSIRVYDTSLTPEESQRNLLVDQCRFGMQVDAFEYDFEGGTLTLSGNFRTDLGFGYDVYALVLDVNGNGTVSTNLLGTIAQAQSASYSLQGLDPNGRYEVGLLLANAERGYANVVRRVSLPSVAEPEPIAWVGKTSDALPWDSTAGWVANNSGQHRLPMDGDTVSIGREAGDYTLNLTGAGALTVKGWSGVRVNRTGITSKTTVGTDTTLKVNGAMTFSDSQSGCRSEFVVDGGNVQVDGSNVINLYGNDVLTVKDGSFLKAATGAADLIVLNGTSRINVQGGEFTMSAVDTNKTDTIAFTGDQGIVQTGGTMSFSAFSTAAQADSFYEISGGALNIHRLYRGHDTSQSRRTSCTTVRPRGSKFDLLVLGGLVSDLAAAFRTLPSLFFDFRVRSDSTPGAKGVGFVDCAGTGVYGVWRIVPDGGLAIVHTNRFPLMVQHDQKTIAIGTMGAQSGAGEQPAGWFMPTGLFDISIPAEQDYMVRADLKPEAELADGWTGAEGVSAGFVKLPRVRNPAKLPRANLKLRVEPQGAKTLASIKADLEAMGFDPVTADETAAYNLVVGLPKDRLARDFPDSKVLIDFTEVTGATAAQQNNVTTNALIKAVSLDIARPGLVLFLM